MYDLLTAGAAGGTAGGAGADADAQSAVL